MDRVGRYLGRKDPKVICMLAGAVSAVGAMLHSQAAKATVYYWDATSPISTAGYGTASGTWGTSAFWSTSTTGAATTGTATTTTSDPLNFGNGATGLAAGTINVGTVNASSLTFASGSGAIVLSGGTITTAVATTITVNNASDTIDSVITGASTSLTKSGTGTLILTDANTYTGGTSISGGTLQIGNGTDTGSLSTSSTITNNATLAFNRSDAIVQGTAFSGSAISGTGGLVMMGGGTLTLNAANTYTGPTTMSDGVLSVATIKDGGVASNIGQSTNAATNLVFNGGTLQYTGATTASNRGYTINSSKTATFDVTANSLFIAGANGTATNGVLKKIGNGTLGLTGVSNNTGGTSVSAGMLKLTSTGTISGTGAVNVSGGTFNVAAQGTGTRTLSNNIVLTGGTVLGTSDNLGALTGGTVTFDGTKVWNTFTTTGASTLTLDSDFSSLNVNYLVVGGGGSGQSRANNSIGQANGGAGGQVRTGTTTLGASTAVTVGTGGAAVVGGGTAGGSSVLGSITATGGATNAQVGSGTAGTTWSVNGVTYGGYGGQGRTFSAGYAGGAGGGGTGGAAQVYTYQVQAIAGTNGLGGGGGGGAVSKGGGGNGYINVAGKAGGSGVVIVEYDYAQTAGKVTLAGDVDVQSASTLDAYGSGGLLDVQGVMLTSTGTGGITIASSNSSGGIVQYSNTNTYLGNTTINDGATLKMNTTNAMPNGVGKGDVQVDGTMNLNGFSTAINSLTGASTGAISGGANSALDVTQGTDGTYSGTIGSNVALTKGGTATLTLDGAAGQVGSTTVNVTDGALTLAGSADNQLNTASVVMLGDSSTAGSLVLGGNATARNQQLDTLSTGSAGGSVVGGDSADSTLTLGNNSVVTNTFNGVLGGAGLYQNNLALTKTGTNTLILNGANTATGAVQVNGGTLLVGDASHTGATLAGAVTVASTGTLGGHGTFNGSVTVQSGGHFAPGGSIGTSTINAGLDLSAGGVFDWELGANSSTGPGTNYDFTSVTGGNLALGGTSALNLQLGSFNPDNGNSFWDTTESWKIIDINGGTNTSLATFASLTNATYIRGYFTTSVGTGDDAGDIFLNYTANDVTTTTYTLTAAPPTLDILKGGSLAGTSTITNTGTGTADTITFSGLSGTSSDTLIATVAGSASSPPVAGTQTANLTVSGVDYGTATVTATVTSADNTTVGGSAGIQGSAGTIAVLVGNATADKNNGRNSFTGNSLGALVTSGSKMADFSLSTSLESKVVTTTGTGGANALGSTATILDSANASQDMTVAMTWRTRVISPTGTDSELSQAVNSTVMSSEPAGTGLISDVVRLSGMAKSGGSTFHGVAETDMFVLQMTYSEAAIVGSEAQFAITGAIHLDSLDPGIDGTIGTSDDRWVNAVALNFGGTSNFVGDTAYSSSYFVLGDWGVDTTNNVVWAVVNHQGDFAAVPEPGSLSLLGLGALGLLGRRRRKNRKSTKVSNQWADRLYGRVKLT